MRTIGRLLLVSHLSGIDRHCWSLAAKYAPGAGLFVLPGASPARRWARSASVSRAGAASPLWEVLAAVLAILWLLYTLRAHVHAASELCCAGWQGVLLGGVRGAVRRLSGSGGLTISAPPSAQHAGAGRARVHEAGASVGATNYYAAQANEYAGRVPTAMQTASPSSPPFSDACEPGQARAMTALAAALCAVHGRATTRSSRWPPGGMFSQFGNDGHLRLLHGRRRASTRTPIRGLAPVYDVPRAGPPAGGRRRGRGKLLRVSGVHGKRKPGISAIPAPLPPTSTATTRFIRSDKTAASEIWADLSDGVRADIQAANEHYAQYEGKVQDAATEGQRYVSEGVLRGVRRAELRRSGGFADRVVPQTGVRRKTAKTKKCP